MGVMLVGCSRPNPLFVLDTEGAGSTSLATSSGAASEASSGASSASAGLSTGAEGTGSSGGESGALDTTGGVVSTSEGTSTGEVMSTGAEGSSSGESTGGGQEEVLEYDLYVLCPEATWNSEGKKMIPLACNVEMLPPPAPWAGQLFPGFNFEGVFEPSVLAEVPYPGIGNSVTGFYSKLTLNGVNSPRLKAVLVCPGPGTCEIVGGIRVEVENVVQAFKENIVLSKGGFTMIDIPLDVVNDGTPFDIAMVVTSKADAPSSHGLWLRPRVVTSP